MSNTIIQSSVEIGGFKLIGIIKSKLCLIIEVFNEADNDTDIKRVVWILYARGYGRADALTHRTEWIKKGFQVRFRECSTKVMVDIETQNQAVQSKIVKSTESDVEKDFKKMVIHASNEYASDMHIRVEDRNDKTTVEFRIAGSKVPQHQFQRSADQGYSLISSVMGFLLKQGTSSTFQKNTRQSGTVEYNFDDIVYRLRMESFPIEGGLKMVARVSKLDESGRASISFESAGYLPQQIMLLRASIMAPSGAIMVAGTTGSGKTTTLQAIASEILMDKGIEMITVENPVELIIKGASQMSVTDKMPFNECLQAAMRGDPDAIMIGEIKDNLSAYTASQAAITGHKVLATTHAGSPMAINLRLEGFDVPRHILASSDFYQLAMYQKLIKHTCPDCSIPYESSDADVMGIRIMRDKHAWEALRRRWDLVLDQDTDWGSMSGNIRVHNLDGCVNCENGLIREQSVVAEAMSMDSTMLDFIHEKKDNHVVSHWLEHGGISKYAHVTQKTVEGYVCPTVAEVCVGSIAYDLIRADQVLSKSEIPNLGGHIKNV